MSEQRTVAMSRPEKIKGLMRCAGNALGGLFGQYGSVSRAADSEFAEKDKLMAGQEIEKVLIKAREEIDQLNRDRFAAKSRIVSMSQTGVDKIKIIPHLQALKRLEARINQKNKLLQNIEVSADTANDAELVIETAKAQKSMLGLQKRTLAQAFKGTDIDDLVDEMQDHHDEVHEISQTLSDMNLGGFGAAGHDDVTEDDFDNWMKENADTEMFDESAYASPASAEGVIHLPGVPFGSMNPQVVELRDTSAHRAHVAPAGGGAKARKAKAAQMTL